MNVYADHILDHYRSPRGRGDLQAATVTHEERNLSCGDALTLHIRIEDNVITQLAWTGNGCAISQAAMSMLTERLAGITIAQAAQMLPRDIFAMLGVPIGPRRLKCALLCLHTLKNALRQLHHEAVQSWLETMGAQED